MTSSDLFVNNESPLCVCVVDGELVHCRRPGRRRRPLEERPAGHGSVSPSLPLTQLCCGLFSLMLLCLLKMELFDVLRCSCAPSSSDSVKQLSGHGSFSILIDWTGRSPPADVNRVVHCSVAGLHTTLSRSWSCLTFDYIFTRFCLSRAEDHSCSDILFF